MTYVALIVGIVIGAGVTWFCIGRIRTQGKLVVMDDTEPGGQPYLFLELAESMNHLKAGTIVKFMVEYRPNKTRK